MTNPLDPALFRLDAVTPETRAPRRRGSEAQTEPLVCSKPNTDPPLHRPCGYSLFGNATEQFIKLRTHSDNTRRRPLPGRRDQGSSADLDCSRSAAPF